MHQRCRQETVVHYATHTILYHLYIIKTVQTRNSGAIRQTTASKSSHGSPYISSTAACEIDGFSRFWPKLGADSGYWFEALADGYWFEAPATRWRAPQNCNKRQKVGVGGGQLEAIINNFKSIYYSTCNGGYQDSNIYT